MHPVPFCKFDTMIIYQRHIYPFIKVVLSQPKQESAQEESLAQLNSLLLQLSEPSELNHHLTAAVIG